MKKHLFTIAFLCFTICSYAQKLVYETNFEAAKAKAIASGKKVMIYIAPNIAPRASTPNVRVTIPQFIEEPQSAKLLNENFTVYKVMSGTDEAYKLMGIHSISILPSYLFYHANGDLFQKISHKQTYNGTYHQVVNEAIDASKKPSISQQKEELVRKPFNEGAFLTVLEARKKIGISDNTDLLNYFVNNITTQRLEDYNTVRFILENGPQIDSRAYKMAYTNRKITDSIYKTEPPAKRVEFNNRIINNSMNSAIEEKNLNRALETRRFIFSTWQNDVKTGLKNGNQRMLGYYSAVNDTASYFKEVFHHVDTYVLNKSAEEVNAESQQRVQQLIAMQKKENSGIEFFTQKEVDSLKQTHISTEEFNKIVNNGGKVVASSRAYGVIPSSAGAELNSFATEVFKTNTTNKSHLARAMVWMQRAIELNPKAEYQHNLSLILYRLGFKLEAQNTMSKAIERAKVESISPTKFSNLLTQMQDGKQL